jgi:Cu-Zn family superoxide dismutase
LFQCDARPSRKNLPPPEDRARVGSQGRDREKMMRLFAMLATAAMIAGQGAPALAATYPLVGPSKTAAGKVILTPAPSGFLLRIEARGLKPGWHGVHFHWTAECGDEGFKAAGGHIHDGGRGAASPVHGLLNPRGNEIGDLPNIYAGRNGEAKAEIFVGGRRLNLRDRDGSALIIHAAADDHLSQPIGGAGNRIACAAIR